MYSRLAAYEDVNDAERLNRAGARSRSQCHGHLTGSGFPVRLGRGYQSVKRFVHKLRGTQLPQAHPVIVTARRGSPSRLRQRALVRDPQTGKYRRTRLFVMTLGYSRKSVRLLIFRSSTRIWAALHEKVFRRLGGSVRMVVPDNLREGARP